MRFGSRTGCRTRTPQRLGEKDYWIFEWNGSTLRDTGQRLQMSGGPAAIRTVEK